ncbi:MAG: DUF1565 domain-containing protein [Cyanobacteria bacterium P01_A01_bin.84]
MNYPHYFPNRYKTDILQVNKKKYTQYSLSQANNYVPQVNNEQKLTAMAMSPINSASQDNKYLGKLSSLGNFSLSCSSLLYLSASVGLASVTWTTTSLKSAIAQTPKTPTIEQADVRSISQVNVLFVNPQGGDDAGNGSESAPLRTITKALEIAKESTVIRLSQGNYSTKSGEEFPLFLKSGVSIEGNTDSRGTGVIISGGGEFLSRTFGSKNVTMVGANNVNLSGITITNTNPRGYGLWIESSSPNITNNTFIGSTQDGIIITGQGSPRITQNNFYRNQANGITITGTSRAEVKENTFQYTGYGINIAQNAEPNLINNQIKFNRSGIVVQASARPILRGNIIENSQEYGLVIISKAEPDLGNSSEPGNNQFRGNGRLDINAKAAKQRITIYGNILQSDDPKGVAQSYRIAGKVDIASSATTAMTPKPRNISSTPPVRVSRSRKVRKRLLSLPASSTGSRTVASPEIGKEIVFSAPLREPQPKNTQIQSIIPPARGNNQSRNREYNFPIPSNLAENNIRESRGRGKTPIAISKAPQAKKSQVVRQFNYINIDPNTIEFTAPQASQSSPPPRYNQNYSDPLPPSQGVSLSNNILNVPSSPFPQSSGSTQQQTIAPPIDETPFNPTGSNSDSQNLRYRVIVEVKTTRDEDLVKFLAPGAFLTQYRRRNIMQAGVFNSRDNAQELMRIFNNNGLKSVVEEL